MTADAFRSIALSMPGSTEGSHMENADFRVSAAPHSRGKIFATIPLTNDDSLAMVKLMPDEQEAFITEFPKAFYPASGAWGRQGCTMVILKHASRAALKRALTAAWRNAAPKALLGERAAKRSIKNTK